MQLTKYLPLVRGIMVFNTKQGEGIENFVAISLIILKLRKRRRFVVGQDNCDPKVHKKNLSIILTRRYLCHVLSIYFYFLKNT